MAKKQAKRRNNNGRPSCKEPTLFSGRIPFDGTTGWYDQHPREYFLYADGSGAIRDLFNFEARQYGYSDCLVWKIIKRLVDGQRKKGKRTLRVLDIGCGPATWDFRIINAYHGNLDLEIVVVDKSERMLDIAKENFILYKEIHGDPKVSLEFRQIDLGKPLPFENCEFDISICLYTVLNHVDPAMIPQAVADMLRVTRDVNFTTVRSRGGEPTVYACKVGDVKSWHQDGDWLFIEDHAGKHFCVRSHLFSVDELKGLFETQTTVSKMIGLDLFVSRHELSAMNLDANVRQQATLHWQWLEEQYQEHPALINTANHIGIISF